MRAPGLSAIILLSATLTAAQSPPATAPREPPAPPPAAILPIPAAAAQLRARNMIHTLFKDDFAKTTPAARDALARRLIAEAAQTHDDPAARYVLLADGSDLAASAGDAQPAIAAIDELSRLYAVDTLNLKKSALLRTATVVNSPEAAETLSRLCLNAADAAALADAFNTVAQLANLAEGAANKTRKVRFVSGIQVHLAICAFLVTEYAEARQALDLLAKDPGDADAHLVVGKFYALHKGQWDIGLPHLAAGPDSTLRALAEKDLAAPIDGAAKTTLGDAWWDFAEKSTGLTHTHTTGRARFWYQHAQKSLSGITLTRIQSRLGSATTAPDSTKPPTLTPTVGNAINLLALIDPAKDAADGKWSLNNGTLVVAESKYALLELPYLMPDEYDLAITFTRTQGDGPVTLLLAANKRAFGFAIDVKGEARFKRIANKIAKDNPTTAPIAISNGRKYTVTVQIRKDSLRALLGEKLITEWKTDYKDLARYGVWKMPDDKLCGLGANNAKVIFHSVEVIEVTGKGKPTR